METSARRSMPKRSISLTEGECSEIRKALVARKVVLCGELWDTGRGDRVLEISRSLMSLLSVYAQCWVSPGIRALVEDEAHVLEDEIQHEVRERIGAFGSDESK